MHFDTQFTTTLLISKKRNTTHMLLYGFNTTDNTTSRFFLIFISCISCVSHHLIGETGENFYALKCMYILYYNDLKEKTLVKKKKNIHTSDLQKICTKYRTSGFFLSNLHAGTAPNYEHCTINVYYVLLVQLPCYGLVDFK